MEKKILLVDDEKTLVELGQELLSDLGFAVTCAYSGEEALRLFEDERQHFDLLITDESMPGISGIELAQRLYECQPELPVVLCSGLMLSMYEEGIATTNIREILLKTEAYLRLPAVLDELLG